MVLLITWSVVPLDAERRHLGLVGVERDGCCRSAPVVVAHSVSETQRRGDLAVIERMQVDAVSAVAGDRNGDTGIDPV